AGCDPAAVWTQAAQSPPGARGVTAVVAAPVWSEQAWATKAPNAVIGITPDTSAGDVARAFVEAHAYAVRANVADLERVLGGPATTVVLTGGGARQAPLARLVAAVMGRPISVPAVAQPAARAGAVLVGRACGIDAPAAWDDGEVVQPGDPEPYDEGYRRYLHAHAALRAHLPDDER
ncbi:MAG TPA: FGGY-family carbohydrate kinase, partial [Acidimicrobiales bacterium]|nr:FGGY-family carbohydrate kinase [Acidimicrobiales bacterium]